MPCWRPLPAFGCLPWALARAQALSGWVGALAGWGGIPPLLSSPGRDLEGGMWARTVPGGPSSAPDRRHAGPIGRTSGGLTPL